MDFASDIYGVLKCLLNWMLFQVSIEDGLLNESQAYIQRSKWMVNILAALGRIQAEHFILFATLIAPFLALVLVLKRYILNFFDILSVSL